MAADNAAGPSFNAQLLWVHHHAINLKAFPHRRRAFSRVQQNYRPWKRRQQVGSLRACAKIPTLVENDDPVDTPGRDSILSRHPACDDMVPVQSISVSGRRINHYLNSKEQLLYQGLRQEVKDYLYVCSTVHGASGNLPDKVSQVQLQPDCSWHPDVRCQHYHSNSSLPPRAERICLSTGQSEEEYQCQIMDIICRGAFRANQYYQQMRSRHE